MLRKKEKQTLTRLFLLGVGAPIGLDRFYEGDVTGGFLAILGFLLALITVVGLLVWLLPFISKTFRLLKEFEDAAYEVFINKEKGDHAKLPNKVEREIIGAALTQSYVMPDDIKGIEFQIRRTAGKPSNINIEDDNIVSNITAQEVQRQFPELTTTRSDGYMAVKYEKLTAVLIAAVNELAAEVEENRGAVEYVKRILAEEAAKGITSE